MTALRLARGVLGVLANAAVEFCRPHRCPIGGCNYRHQRIEVLAAHAKQAHEGIN